jgi:Pyruvate/2-oxoacid:ferredoxin oxidoreductase delta subunit
MGSDNENKNDDYVQEGYHEQVRLNKTDDDGKLLAKKCCWMKCPECGVDLIERDYKNIKVDKCSACEGVWLDTGEMATLMMMAARMRSKI